MRLSVPQGMNFSLTLLRQRYHGGWLLGVTPVKKKTYEKPAIRSLGTLPHHTAATLSLGDEQIAVEEEASTE